MTDAQFVQLTSLILGTPGDEVFAARRAASEAAASVRRSDLLEEARSAATAWVLQAFAGRGSSGRLAATELSISVARSRDRVAVADALADAVAADVVEDLVDGEITETLRSRWDLLAGSAAIPEPGALNDLTRSIRTTGERPGGRTSVVIGVILIVVGFFWFAIDTIAGLLFLIGGLVVLGDALLRRRR